MNNGEIIIYQTLDGRTSVDVRLDNDTVWLNQEQLATLFDKSKSTINEHINNVFKEGELQKEVVVRKFRIATRHGAIEEKTQEHWVMFYNLDVIISVGYRVKSQRGTQFRIWANRILKEYLVKGYAVNQDIAQQKYEELSQLVKVLGRTIKTQPQISSEESNELIAVVSDYTYALDTLDRYDYQLLAIDKTTPEEKFHATYENAMAAIETLKQKFGESRWFGNEKDDSFSND